MEKLNKFTKVFKKIYYKTFIENFKGKLEYNFPDNFYRWDLIEYLIKKNNYRNYLEIGCDQNQLFSKVIIDNKIGVDPVSGGNIRKTSDDFFKENVNKFDIVFIDGLHTYDQVKKDILKPSFYLSTDTVVMKNFSNKKISKMLVEHNNSVINEMISEHAIDEPKIIIFLGDKKLDDDDLYSINSLYPDLAYVRLSKFLKKNPLPRLGEIELDEYKIQIRRNKFGNLYMIANNYNVNKTIVSEAHYSEFVLTTHKNKWFLAFSTCLNKCNNSSTGTDLGLTDILGRTELFESIHQSTVNIKFF